MMDVWHILETALFLFCSRRDIFLLPGSVRQVFGKGQRAFPIAGLSGAARLYHNREEML